MNLQDRYIEALGNAGLLDDDIKEASIRYAMLALKNELVKTVLMVIIFYSLGFFSQFLLVFAVMLPIRMTTGGLHFDTNVKCFTFSLAFYLCSIILFPALRLPAAVYIVLLTASTFLILAMPLFPSEKRPIVSQKKYRLNKTLSASFLFLADFIILAGFLKSSLAHCAVWALFFQALQLLYLCLKRRRNS